MESQLSTYLDPRANAAVCEHLSSLDPTIAEICAKAVSKIVAFHEPTLLELSREQYQAYTDTGKRLIGTPGIWKYRYCLRLGACFSRLDAEGKKQLSVLAQFLLHACRSLPSASCRPTSSYRESIGADHTPSDGASPSLRGEEGKPSLLSLSLDSPRPSTLHSDSHPAGDNSADRLSEASSCSFSEYRRSFHSNGWTPRTESIKCAPWMRSSSSPFASDGLTEKLRFNIELSGLSCSKGLGPTAGSGSGSGRRSDYRSFSKEELAFSRTSLTPRKSAGIDRSPFSASPRFYAVRSSYGDAFTPPRRMAVHRVTSAKHTH
eukprot:ANDGO_01251.mRNA.1 hypothetical protein